MNLRCSRPVRCACSLSALAPLLTAETVISRMMRRVAGLPPDAASVFLSREDLAR